MAVDSGSLHEFLRELGDVLNSNCTLVAAGGTALHNIKYSTEDVDFVVEDGSEKTIREAIYSVNGPQTDLFPAGMVFNNPLPSGYMSRAKDVGVFGALTVLAMDPLDVIMTKIARAEGKDMDDIRACAAHGYTADDIEQQKIIASIRRNCVITCVTCYARYTALIPAPGRQI